MHLFLFVTFKKYRYQTCEAGNFGMGAGDRLFESETFFQFLIEHDCTLSSQVPE